MFNPNLNNKGFTLVEILVTVAIIGILVAIVSLNFDDSKKFSRDEKRQSDLRSMQSAVELYKNKYGRYPEQCAGGLDGWSGQANSAFACSDAVEGFILGNSTEGRPFSEFMPSLPKDPKLNGNNSGYVYRTNSDGSVYKLMVMNTVESESVSYNHPLKSCDYNGSGPTNNDVSIAGMCISAYYNGNNTPEFCRENDSTGRFQSSYGVWGGFKKPLDLGGACSGIVCASEIRHTSDVICR